MKNTFLKYLLGVFVAIGVIIIVFTISWNKPPAYVPMITATATLNFPSTTGGTSSDLTMTVTGSVSGDAVVLGVPNGSTVANGCFTAWISATNTATVRYTNNDLVTSYDPASGTFKITAIKQ